MKQQKLRHTEAVTVRPAINSLKYRTKAKWV